MKKILIITIIICIFYYFYEAYLKISKYKYDEKYYSRIDSLCKLIVDNSELDLNKYFNQLNEIEKIKFINKLIKISDCFQDNKNILDALFKIRNKQYSVYLGNKFLNSNNYNMYLYYIKMLDDELKYFALLSGFHHENKDLKEVLVNEYCKLDEKYHYNTLRSDIADEIKFISLTCLIDKEENLDRKIKLLIENFDILKNSNENFQIFLNFFSKYKDKFFEPLVLAWLKNRDNVILNLIKYYDTNVLLNLMKKINIDVSYSDLIVELKESSIPFLVDGLKNKDYNYRFSCADLLVKMTKKYPEATKFLIDEIYKNNLKFIADNYPFYIRIGIEGTEKILLNALNSYFGVQMCNDYLNCENYILEAGAVEIAHKKGYNIFKTEGRNDGPKWGELKSN